MIQDCLTVRCPRRRAEVHVAIGEPPGFSFVLLLYLHGDRVDVAAPAIQVRCARSVRQPGNHSRIDPFLLFVLDLFLATPGFPRTRRRLLCPVGVFFGALGCVDARQEGHPGAVGAPGRLCGSVGHRRQGPGFAAVHGDQVYLGLVVAAGGDKGQGSAVGTPARRMVLVRAGGELLALALGRRQPDGPAIGVLDPIRGNAHVCDPCAVGADARIFQPFDVEQVFDADEFRQFCWSPIVKRRA